MAECSLICLSLLVFVLIGFVSSQVENQFNANHSSCQMSDQQGYLNTVEDNLLLAQQATQTTPHAPPAPPNSCTFWVACVSLLSVWIDGVKQNVREDVYPSTPESCVIQSNNQVIAVQCEDTDNRVNPGIIGSVNCNTSTATQTVTYTDDSWKCSTVETKGWEEPAFDDYDWDNATDVTVCRCFTPLPIAQIAQLIWTQGKSDDAKVYCRGKLPYSGLTQSPLTTPALPIPAVACKTVQDIIDATRNNIANCDHNTTVAVMTAVNDLFKKYNVSESCVHPCDMNDCRNGAMCVVAGYGYTCDCPPGITGLKCESVIGCSPLIRRSQWKSKTAASSTPLLTLPVKKIIVHVTRNNECYTTEQCLKQVKAIETFQQQYHFTKLDEIGYNYLIGEDGRVYEGTGQHVGNHTKGHNADSYGIAFIGEFNSRLPIDRALKAFQLLLSTSCVTDLSLDSGFTIAPHYDMDCTLCPNGPLRKWILKTYQSNYQVSSYNCRRGSYVHPVKK